MQPEKPVRSHLGPAVMTDWYITNYEGISYLTNLECNMHFVIKCPCPYAYLTVNLSLHTHGPTAMWKRTSAVLPNEKQVENSHTGVLIFLLYDYSPKRSDQHFRCLIGGSEFKLLLQVSWSHGFTFIHSTPLVKSPAYSQSCRRPQSARLIQNQIP